MLTILLGYKTYQKDETPKVVKVSRKNSEVENAFEKEAENYVRFEFVSGDLPFKRKAGRPAKKALKPKTPVKKDSK